MAAYIEIEQEGKEKIVIHQEGFSSGSANHREHDVLGLRVRARIVYGPEDTGPVKVRFDHNQPISLRINDSVGAQIFRAAGSEGNKSLLGINAGENIEFVLPRLNAKVTIFA